MFSLRKIMLIVILLTDVRQVYAIINLTFAVGSSVKTAPITMFTFSFEANYVRKSNLPVIDLLLSKAFESYDKAIAFKERVRNTADNQVDSAMEYSQRIDRVIETLYCELDCSVANSMAFELESKARKRLNNVCIASAALEEDLNHLIVND